MYMYNYSVHVIVILFWCSSRLTCPFIKTVVVVDISSIKLEFIILFLFHCRRWFAMPTSIDSSAIAQWSCVSSTGQILFIYRPCFSHGRLLCVFLSIQGLFVNEFNFFSILVPLLLCLGLIRKLLECSKLERL